MVISDRDLVRKDLEHMGYMLTSNTSHINRFFDFHAWHGGESMLVDAQGRNFTEKEKRHFIEYAKHLHSKPVVARVKPRILIWGLKIEYVEVTL